MILNNLWCIAYAMLRDRDAPRKDDEIRDKGNRPSIRKVCKMIDNYKVSLSK